MLAAAVAMTAVGALASPQHKVVTAAGVLAQRQSVGAAAAAKQETDTLTHAEWEGTAAAGAEA